MEHIFYNGSTKSLDSTRFFFIVKHRIITKHSIDFQISPKYDLISETGPDHSKHFEVRLTLGNELYLGSGTSIKRAQHFGSLRNSIRTNIVDF